MKKFEKVTYEDDTGNRLMLQYSPLNASREFLYLDVDEGDYDFSQFVELCLSKEQALDLAARIRDIYA